MRKALVVGVDHYAHFARLSGCVNDARAVAAAIERHHGGAINFANPRVMTATGATDAISRADLRDAVRDLFAGEPEIALFYFAGHGHLEDVGGFLCGSDGRTGDDGLPLADVMTFARNSRARNKVIVLDSCHGGVAGERPGLGGGAEITDGMTILTASTAEQYAQESASSGVFTDLFVDALGGAAANLVGDVTPGSIYAHIDQSLGPWAQRPVFKTNVKSFVSLRQAAPPIPLADLRALSDHFPTAGFRLALDPSFEPDRSSEQAADPAIPAPDPAKTAVFAVLQRYVRVNLVRPVGATHMWHAAMGSASCELTVLGEHYRKLGAKGLL